MFERGDGALVRLLCAFVLAGVAACGGGSGGGGGDDGGSGGSNWSPGVFQPSASFANRCVNPRPGTGDLRGTVLDENNFLRSWSDETYLWYDEIVDRDPGDFTSPLDYFAVLRTNALTPSGAPKDRFHFTVPTEEWERLSQAGEAAGYGVQWAILRAAPPREVRVAYTEPGSPAT